MSLRHTALCALVAAPLLAVAAPAHASRSQPLYFDASNDLKNPATRADALRDMDAIGVRALRVVMYWRDVAPGADSRAKPGVDLADPASYSWGEYDAIMAAARERGWPVLLTPSTPGPRWAMRSRRDHVTRPSPKEFERFATALGRKYGEQVSTWAAFNEPNHPDFLKPQYKRGKRGRRAVSPRLYRSLFQAMDRGLDATGNAGDVLLAGEAAPRGTGKVVAPLTFLRGTLCLDRRYRKSKRCGRLDADGWAHHPYTTKSGVQWVPPQPNDVTMGALPRLTRALDRAGRAGAVRRRLPVYLTEFGIQSTPDRFFGVSLARQVEYRALGERMAWGNPRVRAFSQYLLRDDRPTPGKTGFSRYGGFESGLRFATGRDKPSLSGFRLTLSALRRGSRVSLWGLVRPAGGPTTVDVLYQNRGSRTFRPLRTVRTDARGYLTLRTRHHAGRRYRLKWGDERGYPVRVIKAR